MRKGAWGIALMLVLGVAAPAATAQMETGPNGMPLRPPGPPDTTNTRRQADQARDDVPLPLKITFQKKTAEWSAPKLAELPHQTFTVHNDQANADQNFTGVPLMELLSQLGVPDKPKGKELRLYLVAEGRDGSKVVYSLGEIVPDVHDGVVLLADSIDGKPIIDNGPLQLVSTRENRSTRWVRNVVSIKVVMAD